MTMDSGGAVGRGHLRLPPWARVLGGVAVLAVVVWHLGPQPFVEALDLTQAWPLVAGAGIAVLTTMCCAWRWSVVAHGLGVDLSWHVAVRAYYRSQLLNKTLPGGVLGDVHRGLRHGRDSGDVGRCVRAVVLERSTGQVVQLGVTGVALLILPSPVGPAMQTATGTVVAACVGAIVAGLVLTRRLTRRVHGCGAPALRVALTDLRDGVLARRSWPPVVLASVLVVCGHTATFLIAARSAGVTASPARLVALALLVLMAMGVPANIAGWGPREGVAAWTFGAAGLGAAQGVRTAVLYGIIVLVANLPGAAIMLADRFHEGHGAVTARTTPSAARQDGAAHA